MKSNSRDEIKHMMVECDIIICIGNQWMSVVKNGCDCYSKDEIVVTKSNWFNDECDPIGWTSTMDKLNPSVTHCTNFIGWFCDTKTGGWMWPSWWNEDPKCCGDEWEEFW